MGVYQRKDSPFHWLLLERAGRKPIRESTHIVVDGGSPPINKEQRRLAQEAYAKRMADLARLRFRIPAPLADRTFKDHRAWYELHVTSTKRGIQGERSMLKQLGVHFDPRELQEIDQTLVREWRTVRKRKVSDSTVAREEALLKHLLTTAVPKYLDKNPLAGLKGLRVAKTDTRILTHDEEDRLLKALQRPEDYALVLCALDTLLRLSDTKDLTRKQDHGTYLFSDTKTSAIRIPISTRLRAALDAVPADGDSYFPSYSIYGKGPVTTMFMAACKAAEVQTGRDEGGISFHCLRHTGASRMLAAGVDVKTVMMIGGWKSLTVLERYLHPTDAAAQEAVNSIAKHAPNTSESKPRKKTTRSA